MSQSRKTVRRFGDFELLQRVGRDGPFHLFRARQVSLDRKVTLKVLPERLATLEGAAVLRRVAEAANRLDHPVVLRAYEVGEAAGTPYLALAPVEGELLAERLKAGPLRPRLAVDLARQLAEALLHAHERGLVHGALRPQVVWLARDGQVRLSGFGSPLRFEELNVEDVAGYAGYLAPEQAGGRGSVGRAADVYGLGALLYAMLTGGPPHQGANPADTFRQIRKQPPLKPSRLHPGLSPALDEICLKCLSRSPLRRYGADRPLVRLIADLKRVRSYRAEPDPLDEVWPWVRRHARLVRTAALLLVFAAIPACWDRQRQHAAWDIVTQPDAQAEDYARALRHFERQAADRPFDAETAAGLALARARTDRPPAATSDSLNWPRDLDEWAAVRNLTRLLVDLKQHRLQAQAELRAARAAGYAPRTEAERRLWAECERAAGAE
ncbi:MAG: serine/threonine-protein kinase [Gemmataceae bacterium]